MKKKILLILLIFLVILQFFPIDQTNPISDANQDFLNGLNANGITGGALIKDACYDCHSNETVFPAYTRIQPIGFFLRSHIRGGRQKLNFSEWQSYPDKKKIQKLQDCIDVINEKRMPMLSYAILHPKAMLSTEQRSELVDFFSKI